MTIQEAIEYGMRWKNAICDRGDTECSEAIQFLNMAIEALEQESGKWQRFNYSDGDVMECTNCGYRDWRDRWLEDEVHNYCPNCGARMESDEQ